ncbi:hypothetical protein B566_EDAN003661 [Ephemera danica]|nr:hypothetical protein B566_EDAN003661 [Ephemera danica]
MNLEMDHEDENRHSNNLALDKAKDLVKGTVRILESEGVEFSPMHEEFSQNKPKWTRLLILTGVVATLGSSMPVGYNIGVMNTPQLIIKEFCNASIYTHYNSELNEIELNLLWSSIVSIFLIGGMAGSLSGGWLADKWGRNPRGYTKINCISGTESTWHFLLSLYGVLILLSVAALPFLPESPKYLCVIRQQEDRGAKELSRLRGIPISELQMELAAIQASSKRELEAGKWSIAKLVKTRSLRWPLILVCALQGGQQLSGINAVFYYSVPIFLSAGLGEAGSQYASIGAGFVNLFVASLAMVLANKYSRRKLMFFSCSTACACLILLSIAIATMETITWMPYFSIAMVLSYVFFYGIGLGPIPYFIGSELFTVGPRPAAMALGSMSNWTGNFIVGMTFPSLQAVAGALSFVPFVVSTALLGLLLWWKLPETLGVEPVELGEERPLRSTN